MSLAYVEHENVTLKAHPEFDERWVQQVISEDPSILGLGDLVLKDAERLQPRAGRLDLLLQDPDEYRRYEVEIQLGATDETHIIRTIEYWDIERKRYPQYEHTAVIVAEEITSRFFNVISLFNGFIPLVAIQMNAYQIKENMILTFTTVLDEMSLGLVEEDEEVQEPANREYWVNERGTPQTVSIADDLLEIINSFGERFNLNYTKYYIGLAQDGKPNNFARFRPQKNAFRLEVRLPREDERNETLEQAGLDVMSYDRRSGRYRIRLSKGDVKQHGETLSKLLRDAYEEAVS